MQIISIITVEFHQSSALLITLNLKICSSGSTLFFVINVSSIINNNIGAGRWFDSILKRDVFQHWRRTRNWRIDSDTDKNFDEILKSMYARFNVCGNLKDSLDSNSSKLVNKTIQYTRNRVINKEENIEEQFDCWFGFVTLQCVRLDPIPSGNASSAITRAAWIPINRSNRSHRQSS